MPKKRSPADDPLRPRRRVRQRLDSTDRNAAQLESKSVPFPPQALDAAFRLRAPANAHEPPNQSPAAHAPSYTLQASAPHPQANRRTSFTPPSPFRVGCCSAARPAPRPPAAPRSPAAAAKGRSS